MKEKQNVFYKREPQWRRALSFPKALMGFVVALTSFGLVAGGLAAHSLPSSQEATELCELGELEIQGWNLCFHYEYLEGPYVNPRGERRFSSGMAHIYSPQGQALESEPHFYLWMKMPHNHEHGGRPLKVQALREGIFQVEEMLLMSMPGQWFLRLNLDGIPQNPAQDYHAEWALTEWE